MKRPNIASNRVFGLLASFSISLIVAGCQPSTPTIATPFAAMPTPVPKKPL